jgi:hypothetical protein
MNINSGEAKLVLRPGNAEPPKPLDVAWLRQLCLDCGADDAGLVEISRPALDDQRADILRYFPPTKTLLSFVCRMNKGAIRSPARSASNREFHASYGHSNEVARKGAGPVDHPPFYKPISVPELPR